MLIFKFKKCLILSLLFLSACYASAAEISIKECLSAQVDVAALNSLNSMALSIFPYTLEDSSSPDIKKVSSEEYIQKVIEFQKNKDSMAKYEKLLDNLQIFFVSGGIMIKSMDPKAKANKGYYSCGTYSRDPISENILKDIPNLSPLLVGAVSKKLIQAAAKHQEVLLGRTADNLYFLVFGYSGWGAKNRKNAEEFNQVMACTIDQIDDSGNRISDDNVEF